MIHYVFMFLCRNVYTSPLEFYKQYIKTLQFFLNTEVYPLSWTEKSNLEGILVMKSDDAFKKQIVEANQRGEGSYQTLVNRYSITTFSTKKWLKTVDTLGFDALHKGKTKQSYSSQFKPDIIHYYFFIRICYMYQLKI